MSRRHCTLHVDSPLRRFLVIGHGGLLAPMPGRIITLLVEPGEKVGKGAPLLVLEAMKMEHKLTAPATGAVRAFLCAVDDQVSEGAELVEFEPETI